MIVYSYNNKCICLFFVRYDCTHVKDNKYHFKTNSTQRYFEVILKQSNTKIRRRQLLNHFLNTFVHLNLFDKTQGFVPQVFETGCKPVLFQFQSCLVLVCFVAISIFANVSKKIVREKEKEKEKEKERKKESERECVLVCMKERERKKE